MKYCSVLLLALACCLSGCGDSGPDMGKVTGTLTMNGTPYPNAMIVFQPKDGGPMGVSSTDNNGKFNIWSAGKEGAMLGTHKVTITTMKKPDDASQPAELRSDDPAYEAMASSTAADYAKAEKEKAKEPIPAKYNTNSDLVYTVRSGSNTFDLDMK